LAAEIDTLVGKRGRRTFLTRAAEKELMRLRQIKALEGAAGAWMPLALDPIPLATWTDPNFETL
jgi:hypothetical protein